LLDIGDYTPLSYSMFYVFFIPVILFIFYYNFVIIIKIINGIEIFVLFAIYRIKTRFICKIY